MTVRVIAVDMRLVGLDGRTIEMTEYAPWPERCGIWEAEREILHDGARYEYAGCENDVYLYREMRSVGGRAERRPHASSRFAVAT